MIVVDASAVVDALAPRLPEPVLTQRLLGASELHAPHLIDVEVTSALRRLVARGEISEDRAADARTDASSLPFVHYPHAALLERAWELRHQLSIQDGVYVALAELLEMPLVTCDAGIARTHGSRADIELYRPLPS